MVSPRQVASSNSFQPLLQLTDINKSFGALTALQDVNLEIDSGQVVGLAGRSGAGKSVLMMCISGLLNPDRGEMYFAGQRQRWPFKGRQLGIEIIHQKPELVDSLDICSNVFIGGEILLPSIHRWRIVWPRQRMEKMTERVLAEIDFEPISVQEKVTNLSSEQRQLVAIARAMTRPTRLMLVDDPAPLLNYHYQQRLLSLIESWRDQGRAVIFSSQNLDHLFQVTDRIVVLRDGQVAADLRTDETNREEVVNATVGTTARQQLTPIIWALDSYYQARENAEKLSRNQRLLTQDLAARTALNQQLMDQLNEQVKALDSANLALQDAHRRLLTEREEERKHLARELHDQTIQDLLSINYQLEQVEADLTGQSDVEDELRTIRADIRRIIDDLRHVCSALRPPTIDSLGLGAAVKSYAAEWSRRAGIKASIKNDSTLKRLPESIELSIFRIIQESLNNVRQHASANSVEIDFEPRSPRMLMITISDDGRGLSQDFDLSALSAERHYGLLGISERVALLGGRLTFQNRENGGLVIQIEIPHPRVGA